MRLPRVLTLTILLFVGIAALSGAAAAEPTAERSVDEPAPEPGDTVTVTLTLDLEESAPVDVVETVSPAVASAEVQTVEQDGEDVLPSVTNADAEGVVVLVDADQVAAGQLRIQYSVTVPEDAASGDTVAFESVVQVDGTQLSVTEDSPAELTVDGGSDGGLPGGSDDGTESDGGTDEEADETAGSEGTDDAAATSDEADDTDADDEDDADATDDSTDDEDALPGFGVVAALAALSVVGLQALARRA